jgi:hypothetical protein
MSRRLSTLSSELCSIGMGSIEQFIRRNWGNPVILPEDHSWPASLSGFLSAPGQWLGTWKTLRTRQL